MKTVKSRGYKECLKNHKDSIIKLHSPGGLNGGILYSLSADGIFIGMVMGKKEVGARNSLGFNQQKDLKSNKHNREKEFGRRGKKERSSCVRNGEG